MKAFSRWGAELQPMAAALAGCGLGLSILALGCATAQRIDWNSRIGHYTHDEAVLEMGPADKQAQLTDGTKVAEWLLQRGYSRGSFYAMPGYWVQHYADAPTPDYYLRLTFDPSGRLKEWKKVVK